MLGNRDVYHGSGFFSVPNPSAKKMREKLNLLDFIKLTKNFFNPKIFTVLSSQNDMDWLRDTEILVPDPDPRVKKAPDPENCKTSLSSLVMVFY